MKPPDTWHRIIINRLAGERSRKDVARSTTIMYCQVRHFA
jgi:hypothetical protein